MKNISTLVCVSFVVFASSSFGCATAEESLSTPKPKTDAAADTSSDVAPEVAPEAAPEVDTSVPDVTADSDAASDTSAEADVALDVAPEADAAPETPPPAPTLSVGTITDLGSVSGSPMVVGGKDGFLVAFQASFGSLISVAPLQLDGTPWHAVGVLPHSEGGVLNFVGRSNGSYHLSVGENMGTYLQPYVVDIGGDGSSIAISLDTNYYPLVGRLDTDIWFVTRGVDASGELTLKFLKELPGGAVAFAEEHPMVGIDPSKMGVNMFGLNKIDTSLAVATMSGTFTDPTTGLMSGSNNVELRIFDGTMNRTATILSYPLLDAEKKAHGFYVYPQKVLKVGGQFVVNWTDGRFSQKHFLSFVNTSGTLGWEYEFDMLLDVVEYNGGLAILENTSKGEIKLSVLNSDMSLADSLILATMVWNARLAVGDDGTLGVAYADYKAGKSEAHFMTVAFK